jgi:hypothetical protein
MRAKLTVIALLAVAALLWLGAGVRVLRDRYLLEVEL